MTPKAFEKKYYASLLDTGRVDAWEIGLRSASRNGSAGIVLRWRLGDDVEVEVIRLAIRNFGRRRGGRGSR